MQTARFQRPRLILAATWLLALYAADLSLSADEKPLYANNFDKAEPGTVPDDFLVLDGGFTVKAVDGQKLLELPGAPLETFAVQFGPSRSNDVAVSAAIRGTGKGRRFPVFGVGAGGVAGFKLQVTPAKQALEIYRDADLKASVPFRWSSGTWVALQLTIHGGGAGPWRVEGKCWERGKPVPGQPMVVFESKEAPLSGRCSVFGSPFSGEPIQFDDFVVSEISGS